MPVLTAGGPALVHFLDFAQLNSVRTLPYVAEWDRRYREAGLRTIGVQAPRFPFGADPEAVAAGLERLGVGFPVAIDAEPRALALLRLRGLAQPLPLEPRRGAEPGSTSARASTPAPRRRSRPSCASRTRCGTCPRRIAPLRATDAPGARVMAPTPGGLPGRLLGAALDRGRGRRGAGPPLRGRRRPRDGRGQTASWRSSSTARRASRCAIAGRRPLRPRRAPPAREPRARPAPLARPARLVGELRRRRALAWACEPTAYRSGGDRDDQQAGLRRHPVDRQPSARAPSTSRRSGCGPTRTPASSAGPATPASRSGSRRKWGWSSRRRRTPIPALHVDDVAAARAELEEKGVEFNGDAFDSGVCHMAFFTDPDGNDLMLHQPLRARTSRARRAPRAPRGSPWAA